MSLSEDKEKMALLWSERAWAYSRMVEDHQIFTDLADRLVDMVESAFMESVLDVGSGTGLLGQRILEIYPGVEVHLVEPSEAMQELAERRLGSKAIYHDFPAEGPYPADLKVASALSSASIHLMDVEAVFKSLAAVLRPGGTFAFNVWWHTYDETMNDNDMMLWWKNPIEEALDEIGERPPKWPEPPLRAKLSRSKIEMMAAVHGYTLVSIDIDEDEVETLFGIEYMAMDREWPKPGLGKKRNAVITSAKKMVEGSEIIKTVRVKLKKN